jgi:hypothetical protein
MAIPGKSVLLDTSVVVRHFRDGNALVSHLAAFEELYLPQAALAELYAGAFRSARPRKTFSKSSASLRPWTCCYPMNPRPSFTVASPLNWLRQAVPSRKTTSGSLPSRCNPSAAGDCRPTFPARHWADRALVLVAGGRSALNCSKWMRLKSRLISCRREWSDGDCNSHSGLGVPVNNRELPAHVCEFMCDFAVLGELKCCESFIEAAGERATRIELA